MKALISRAASLLRLVASSLVGALVVSIIFGIYMLNDRPDLKVWHETKLDGEFRASTGLENFAQYLELEERLFAQLDQQIYQKIEPEDQRIINRYYRGSLADPGRWPHDWNRSFVRPAEQAGLGVLLIHGMSDSPYSLRSIGQTLHQHGAYVLGLRVPGHGQAPSGLLEVKWEDMAAAVRLAMAELRQQVPGSPLYIVGYSNGGALAVQYTLDSLRDDELARLDGLVLLSPEIGVTRLAKLTFWQERIGRLLGLKKLAWNSILPEYDPWKYGSFSINAAKQAYRITAEIQRQLDRLDADSLATVPPILAFQSVVDTTVTAPALVSNLFNRLPAIAPGTDDSGSKQHELVLYDINREAEIEPLMLGNPSAWIDAMLRDQSFSHALTLVSNKNRSSHRVSAYKSHHGSTEEEQCDIGLSWPQDIYSLSHVALPFPVDDPTYGQVAMGDGPGISLGRLALRGEKNVLQVSPTDMLRLRHNPFYSYQEQRALAFLQLIPTVTEQCVQGQSLLP